MSVKKRFALIGKIARITGQIIAVDGGSSAI